MLVILTKKDLDRRRKNKPVDVLSESEDFKHYPHNMPSENLYEYFSITDTLVFLGDRERRKHRKEDSFKGNLEGRVFHINKMAGTNHQDTNERVIALLIRQLAHEQEIEIDFKDLVIAISASLTSQECADIAIELEKQAILKA